MEDGLAQDCCEGVSTSALSCGQTSAQLPRSRGKSLCC